MACPASAYLSEFRPFSWSLILHHVFLFTLGSELSPNRDEQSLVKVVIP